MLLLALRLRLKIEMIVLCTSRYMKWSEALNSNSPFLTIFHPFECVHSRAFGFFNTKPNRSHANTISWNGWKIFSKKKYEKDPCVLSERESKGWHRRRSTKLNIYTDSHNFKMKLKRYTMYDKHLRRLTLYMVYI